MNVFTKKVVSSKSVKPKRLLKISLKNLLSLFYYSPLHNFQKFVRVTNQYDQYKQLGNSKT